jgi:predicted MFS family arabinose efflux permease
MGFARWKHPVAMPDRPDISPPGNHLPNPLHYANFRRAFTARIVSGVGSWMQTVAAGWLVYKLTGSATAVGVLTVMSRGPSIALAAWGGELADRFDRRRLLIAMALIQAVGGAALAAVTWNEHSVAGVLPIYLPIFAMGIAGALSSAGQETVVTSSVPPELARRATGYASVGYNLARLVGPALGGVLVVAIGAGPCFAFNALTYVFVAAAMWGLELPPRESGPSVRIREAVTEARADVFLRDLLAGAAMFALIIGPIQELAPSIARAQGNGAHLLGFLLAALAFGGLLGNLVRTKLEVRGAEARSLIAGSLIAGAMATTLLGMTSELGIGLLGEGYDYGLALFAMVFAGGAWDVIFVVALTGVQLEDRRVAGMMTGLFFTVTVAGVTVGALLMGALFDLANVGTGLLVAALAISLVGLRFLRAEAPGPAVPAAVEAAG